jgi:hypothetical protein
VDELERWVVIVWILWPPESQNTAEVNLVLAMSSLAHEQPDALRKLEQLMEKWSRATNQNIPKFQTIPVLSPDALEFHVVFHLGPGCRNHNVSPRGYPFLCGS